ncbi:MAG: hypothetical protein QXJ32_08340 [Thermoplasmata archaeon]
MKYLYCPRCKDLRVKSWYAIRDRCVMCFGPATPIKIPNTWMTYALYALYVITPALILIYVSKDDRDYLYAAVVALAFMIVFSWIEIGRGLAYARTKIKMPASNVSESRGRGRG